MKEKRPSKLRPSNRIQHYRFERGMSQRALAKAVGVSPFTIIQWESGIANPNVDNLKKLCEVLNVDKKDLIFLEL